MPKAYSATQFGFSQIFELLEPNRKSGEGLFCILEVQKAFLRHVSGQHVQSIVGRQQLRGLLQLKAPDHQSNHNLQVHHTELATCTRH